MKRGRHVYGSIAAVAAVLSVVGGGAARAQEPALPVGDPDSLFNRAYAAWMKGKTENAIDDFTKAIAGRKNFSHAYFFRGTVYYAKRDYARALEDFDRVVEIKPNIADTYVRRAAVYRKQGRRADARAELDVAEAKAAGRKSALRGIALERGHQAFDRGDFVGALAEYDRTLGGANRWNVEPYAARAAAYLRCARYEEALADCEAGLKLKPGDPGLLEVQKLAVQKRQQGALGNFPP